MEGGDNEKRMHPPSIPFLLPYLTLPIAPLFKMTSQR